MREGGGGSRCRGRCASCWPGGLCKRRSWGNGGRSRGASGCRSGAGHPRTSGCWVPPGSGLFLLWLVSPDWPLWVIIWTRSLRIWSGPSLPPQRDSSPFSGLHRPTRKAGCPRCTPSAGTPGRSPGLPASAASSQSSATTTVPRRDWDVVLLQLQYCPSWCTSVVHSSLSCPHSTDTCSSHTSKGSRCWVGAVQGPGVGPRCVPPAFFSSPLRSHSRAWINEFPRTGQTEPSWCEVIDRWTIAGWLTEWLTGGLSVWASVWLNHWLFGVLEMWGKARRFLSPWGREVPGLTIPDQLAQKGTRELRGMYLLPLLISLWHSLLWFLSPSAPRLPWILVKGSFKDLRVQGAVKVQHPVTAGCQCPTATGVKTRGSDA